MKKRWISVACIHVTAVLSRRSSCLLFLSCFFSLSLLVHDQSSRESIGRATSGADRLVGLVVKAFASREEDPGLASGSSHTSDLRDGTPVATLPCVSCYRGNAGTGWPGVSILRLGEIQSWIRNLHLCVAARKTV